MLWFLVHCELVFSCLYAGMQEGSEPYPNAFIMLGVDFVITLVILDSRFCTIQVDLLTLSCYLIFSVTWEFQHIKLTDLNWTN